MTVVLIFISFISQYIVWCQDIRLKYDVLLPSNFLELAETSDVQVIHDGIPSGFFSFIQGHFTPMTTVNLLVIHSPSEVSTLQIFPSHLSSML